MAENCFEWETIVFMLGLPARYKPTAIESTPRYELVWIGALRRSFWMVEVSDPWNSIDKNVSVLSIWLKA